MVEVPHKEYITYEKPFVPRGDEIKPNKAIREQKSTKPIKYTSKAGTVRGQINGLIQKFSSEEKSDVIYTPMELRILMQEVLEKFNKLYPQKITKVVIIEGWEGKGDYPIEKNIDNDFVVEIWREDKKTKMVVKKDDLNGMLDVIRKLDKKKIYKCYDIADLMGLDWRKDIWANRMEVYFPKYYAPLKILDRLGIIDYGGNKKTIVRLK